MYLEYNTSYAITYTTVVWAHACSHFVYVFIFVARTGVNLVTTDTLIQSTSCLANGENARCEFEFKYIKKTIILYDTFCVLTMSNPVWW